MPDQDIGFHRLAIREYLTARRWYARRNPEVAQRFVAAMHRAVQQIAAGPEQWPIFQGRWHWVRLRRFPYVLYYPLDSEGADAEVVHDFLCCVEQLALKEGLSSLENVKLIDRAKNAGAQLQKWIEAVTQFGAASFLDEAKYFVPIPVALVSIDRSDDSTAKTIH